MALHAMWINFNLFAIFSFRYCCCGSCRSLAPLLTVHLLFILNPNSTCWRFFRSLFFCFSGFFSYFCGGGVGVGDDDGGESVCVMNFNRNYHFDTLADSHSLFFSLFSSSFSIHLWWFYQFFLFAFALILIFFFWFTAVDSFNETHVGFV